VWEGDREREVEVRGFLGREGGREIEEGIRRREERERKSDWDSGLLPPFWPVL